jgi:hypothetical protein
MFNRSSYSPRAMLTIWTNVMGSDSSQKLREVSLLCQEVATALSQLTPSSIEAIEVAEDRWAALKYNTQDSSRYFCITLMTSNRSYFRLGASLKKA